MENNQKTEKITEVNDKSPESKEWAMKLFKRGVVTFFDNLCLDKGIVVLKFLLDSGDPNPIADFESFAENCWGFVVEEWDFEEDGPLTENTCLFLGWGEASFEFSDHVERYDFNEKRNPYKKEFEEGCKEDDKEEVKQ